MLPLRQKRYTFSSDFLYFKAIKFLQPKLSLAMKPHYIYREMLTDISRESEGATFPAKLLNPLKTIQSVHTCRAKHRGLILYLSSEGYENSITQSAQVLLLLIPVAFRFMSTVRVK
jgi:hypothetical protein